ncbi:hypothetical protein DQ244_17245 [Blastococcus sp. TBT05-19]|nr:hypothetical protein [Blastococcus sp. TBT05-19]RBY87084.1 hypothetical protein DQ244_17245 [Blastococcus sp. TBT05-19]
MRTLFVDQAPHTEHRRSLYRALQGWLNSMRTLLPTGGTAWLNGGFVTHKTSPPKDVDVVLMVHDADVMGLTPTDEILVRSQLTDRSAGTQPMGGLVDAFIAQHGNAREELIWDTTWSAVKDDTGLIVPGAAKGYLEVSW